MTDFGVYWPFFSKRNEPWPLDGWRLGSGSRLADVERGDRLWLFTSGKKCKMKLKDRFVCDPAAENAGFLTQVLTVESIAPDRQGGFDLDISADMRHSPQVDPPLLIDHLVRPEGADGNISIGRFRQAAWKLPANTVDLLKELLRRERKSAYQGIEWE